VPRSPRSVAFIGSGTIARAVARRLEVGDVPGMTLLGFLARSPDAQLPGPALDAAALLTASVVVEAAGHDALREHGEAVLGHGTPLVCLSVGALADAELRRRLFGAAEASGARLLVASGAVGGLDLLRAAADAGLDEVVVEQRKPANTLLPAAEAAALAGPLVVFDGPVTDVVARFPTTTNVAAAVALAGIGFDDTRARVIADPALGANQVCVSARGAFGAFTLELANVASANPRTSAIVAHSVVATLRALAGPVVVPA
jgi:aspartate dehydrogenase